MAFPIMAVIAAVQAVASIAQAAKQSKLAKQINPVNPQYKPSEYALANLGLAKQLYGGRMPGASQLQDNIYSNQANVNANVARNATSGSQALALAGAIQGQSNQSLGQLAQMEAQDKSVRGANLSNAYEGMVRETDKMFENSLRQYREDVAAKTALRNASAQNLGNAFNSALSIAGSYDGWRSGNNVNGVTGSDPRYSGTLSGVGTAPMAGGINTSSALMGRSMQPLAMGNAPMVMNGFNTNPQAPMNYGMRFNYMTGRWE